MAEAFPLYWPEGWARTRYRERSRFKTGFGAARNVLFAEIERMGGSRVIVSTNVPLRIDGLPRANMPEPGDPGVAVYFRHKGRDMVFACDKFVVVRDNVYAIAKTIEALRGIERWGASDMMERAFKGFAQLTASRPWREVLGLEGVIRRDDVEHTYRRLAFVCHPDRGGDPAKWHELQQAREQALREIA